MHSFTNHDLLAYLKTIPFAGGAIDKLKIYYRPLVCPFVEWIGMIEKNSKVGDIGCGSGQFLLLASVFAEPSAVFGIEINDRLIENANSLFKREVKIPYKFQKFDGKIFPEFISDLDIVFLNDVLHHVPKNMQRKFIDDLTVRLKKNATLVIKDINAESLLVYFNKLHDLLFAGEVGNEIKFQVISSWIKDNGLEILRTSKKKMYVYPHYTIVAKKK